MHVASAYFGSEEVSEHFESFVCSLSMHFCKRLFIGLEPKVSLLKTLAYNATTLQLC